MKTALIALFLAAICSAQTPAPNDTGSPAQPQYILAAGIGFNHSDTPQCTGELSFAPRVADGLYNISTLKLTSKVSTISTGIAKRFYVGQGFTMSALVDGGVATGGGNVGGIVSGGGVLTYDISRIAKMPGAFVYGAVKIAQSSLGGVSPSFSFGFGKSF